MSDPLTDDGLEERYHREWYVPGRVPWPLSEDDVGAWLTCDDCNRSAGPRSADLAREDADAYDDRIEWPRPSEVEHQSDCLVGRAQALQARIDAALALARHYQEHEGATRCERELAERIERALKGTDND